MNYELSPLGDAAVIIQLGTDISLDTHHAVRSLTRYLEDHPIPGTLDLVPAFTSVTLYYNPIQVQDHNDHDSQGEHSPYESMCKKLHNILERFEPSSEKEARTIEIPVCYGGELGPDLEEVADHNQLSVDEVIDIHSNGDYLVYMLGFAPGFPYIGGMSEKIATPRRDDPRTSIPAGSVGIAGSQTGVYPIETPGGWQLIGQTPLKLFDLDQDPPTLLEAGDKIRFKPISLSEFKELKEGQS
ncbi:5-oxoprolinase subunit PxpB [Pseudalkalibacillus sp. SCS-8]|uniref:5-oxoprolinase subunit PxpB n=1 Tax=Pseudalkalibacillus nanhaiensis TaxID=3115291 RepID=UPI0032DBF200